MPALAALLGHEHLGTYARYGLEPIADPSAVAALRNAMLTLKGVALIGVINSTGKRRDAQAIPHLTKMMHGADSDAARASAAALGAIGGASAMKEIQTALSKTKGPLRMAVAGAGLVCAERLLADGSAGTGHDALHRHQRKRDAQGSAPRGDGRDHPRRDTGRPGTVATVKIAAAHVDGMAIAFPRPPLAMLK